MSKMDNDHTCMELALEGERLCKGGDYRAGVAFLETAIETGTSDLQILSAIYSQLGNASFHLGDYVKATEYHKQDLALTRSINDKLGEAKASGNLGNTLKVIGNFDDAIICCRRHLDISRELNDKVGEGRALYNLGNVYHAKGKHIGKVGRQEPGDFPEEVKSCLLEAVDYYTANLRLVVELGDRLAQGRAYGNLGNTHYLLGNFALAITYHKERLKVAKEFGDKPAERRAHSNLGNACIFLGDFETAAENYKRTLILAQELGDRAVEAQACYSLGNTYTLLHNYVAAIDYHTRHLEIARELFDKIGEARACWSLGNAHTALGNHENAVQFAKKHLEVSKEIGDHNGQAAAQMSLTDLKKVINFNDTSGESFNFSIGRRDVKKTLQNSSLENTIQSSPIGSNRSENLSNLKDNLSEKMAKDHALSTDTMDCPSNEGSSHDMTEKEIFFELLSRCQSKRMDDQRCSLLTLEDKENQRTNSVPRCVSNCDSFGSAKSENTTASINDDFLDMIAGIQSKRLDEQRASLPCLPRLNNNNNNAPNLLQFPSRSSSTLPDENFFDMLMRCQGTRIEDQRSSLPVQRKSAPTVPDEDFFGLIMRVQSGRIDDQRSELHSQIPHQVSSKANGKERGIISRNNNNGSSKIKSTFKAGRWNRNKR